MKLLIKNGRVVHPVTDTILLQDILIENGRIALLERGLEGLTEADLTEMLRFANTAAYIVTTRKGAIRSMPEREQVLALLREN